MFDRPSSLFNNGAITDGANLPTGVVNVTLKAGDAVVMTEMLAHGTLQWKPKDRLRRILVLRYRPQFKGQPSVVTEPIRNRLSPEIQELMAHAHYTYVKEVVKKEEVRLS